MYVEESVEESVEDSVEDSVEENVEEDKKLPPIYQAAWGIIRRTSLQLSPMACKSDAHELVYIEQHQLFICCLLHRLKVKGHQITGRTLAIGRACCIGSVRVLRVNPLIVVFLISNRGLGNLVKALLMIGQSLVLGFTHSWRIGRFITLMCVFAITV